MANIYYPKQTKLFIGCIFSREEILDKACKMLERKYGPIDTVSDTWSFSHTNYYEKEMGKKLFKNFISFRNLIYPEDIKNVKVFSNDLENTLQEKFTNSDRVINLDPGYLDLAKVILATTKDYTHRMYLGNGIYAEVELYYQKKTYQFWPWTYPDYKSKEYISFFLKLRGLYQKNLLSEKKINM